MIATAAVAVCCAPALSGCTSASVSPPAPKPVKPAANPFQAGVTARSFQLRPSASAPRPPSGARPVMSISISARNDRICWQFSGLNVPVPLFAFIHRGGPQVTGPVVVALGRRFTASGCVTGVAPGMLVQIEAHPARYYLAVDDQAHPLGAVRAQL